MTHALVVTLSFPDGQFYQRAYAEPNWLELSEAQRLARIDRAESHTRDLVFSDVVLVEEGITPW